MHWAYARAQRAECAEPEQGDRGPSLSPGYTRATTQTWCEALRSAIEESELQANYEVRGNRLSDEPPVLILQHDQASGRIALQQLLGSEIVAVVLKSWPVAGGELQLRFCRAGATADELLAIVEDGKIMLFNAVGASTRSDPVGPFLPWFEATLGAPFPLELKCALEQYEPEHADRSEWCTPAARDVWDHVPMMLDPELLGRPLTDHKLTGHWGYGANSYAFYYIEQDGSHGCFLRLGFGGVYTGPDQDRSLVLQILEDYAAWKSEWWPQLGASFVEADMGSFSLRAGRSKEGLMRVISGARGFGGLVEAARRLSPWAGGPRQDVGRGSLSDRCKDGESVTELAAANQVQTPGQDRLAASIWGPFGPSNVVRWEAGKLRSSLDGAYPEPIAMLPIPDRTPVEVDVVQESTGLVIHVVALVDGVELTIVDAFPVFDI